MTRLSIPLLLAATALVPAAHAQDNQQQNADQMAQSCDQLVNYVEQNRTDDTGITAERAERIAGEGDRQTCNDALRMARGDISADEDAQNYDADAMARIRVIVPDPQVTVDQSAPEVTVDQRAPEVAVDPGRPQVTVNQKQPVVSVETTPPRITIDMPKPEILVQMPDPDVDIAMAKPRISVEQPEPEVNVEQGEVRVQMGKETDTGEDTGRQASVDVESEQAEVQVQQPAQSQVQISEVRPRVRYNAAEPRVEVSEAGEPEIQFNQSGEANVQFRQMTADETRQAAAEERDRATQDQARNEAGGQARDQAQNQAMTETGEQGSQDRTGQDQAMDERDAQDANLEARMADEPAGQDGERADVGTAEEAPDAVAAVDSEQVAGEQARQPADANQNLSVMRSQGGEVDQNRASELVRVEQLLDMSVIGSEGESIGDVENVVFRGDAVYVVVGSGGFLGLGEKQVALPFADMMLRGDELVMRQITDEDVASMEEVDVDDFENFGPDGELEVGVQG